MKTKVLTTTNPDGLRTPDHRTYSIGGHDYQGLTSAFPDKDLIFAHLASIDARCRDLADEYVETGEVTYWKSGQKGEAWERTKGHLLDALNEKGAISKAGLFSFGLARTRGSYCADVLSRALLADSSIPEPTVDDVRTWMPYAPDDYLESTRLCAVGAMRAAGLLHMEVRRRFPKATLFGSELVCFHEDHEYACTSDIVYWDNEAGLIPVELKTSLESRWERHWMMQLALQGKATHYVDGSTIKRFLTPTHRKPPCGFAILVTPSKAGIRFCEDLRESAAVALGYIRLALAEKAIAMPKEKFVWHKEVSR